MDHKNDIIGKEECMEIINKRLAKDNLKDYNLKEYKVLPVHKMIGLMGQYYTLRITVLSSSIPEEKTFHFFIKSPPIKDTAAGTWEEEYGVFMRELQMYTKVLPAIMGNNHNSIVAECFLSIENKAIVLEDMAVYGYKIVDKLKPMDLDHCRVVMKTLAKFHARSFIYEEVTKKKINKEFSCCLSHTSWQTEGTVGPQWHAAGVKGIVSLIDLLDDLDETAKDVFKNRVQSLAKILKEQSLPSRMLRNVLCHGDLGTNNLLFQYDDSGKPAGCCIIDFQLVKYTPPAQDILLFLQCSTLREFRRVHMSELIRLYYDTLSTDLTEAHLNPTEVFSLQDLLASLDELRIFGLLQGVFNIPIAMSDSSAVMHILTQDQGQEIFADAFVDRSSIYDHLFRNSERYRKRIKDVFLELYDEIVN